jgi:hypothetical protein
MENLELKLGKNKVVKIKPWKTKTKKDFINIIKNKKDKLTEDDILKTLILPYVEPNNLYFSEDELQFILINIRNISIKDNIKFFTECKNCKENIEINTKIINLCEYSPNEYPIIENDISWKDIESDKELQENIKKHKDELPSNIEMLMHIDGIKNKKFKNIEEVIEFFDDLSLDENEKLFKDYSKVKSSIEIKYTTKCPECKTQEIYTFEEIPDFFNPLLPEKL